MALRLLLLTATLLVCAQAAEPVRILLLTGEQGGPYHAWEQTNPVLKSILDKAGLFAVDVLTAPPKGGDFSQFRPEWSKYKAVVANYDAPDERWPAELKESFETYVRNGGGFVSVHAADNAFAGWRAYNLMIGIGGWRGRDEKSGPLWYYRDGKLMSDPSPGKAGSHGARKPFVIENRVKNHPITKGLPDKWMHVTDELYATLRGPGENMTVLSTAYSDPNNKGTGRDEPVLMVLSFGRGRVFHTTLGHDVAAVSGPAFGVTLLRGTEWAATGKVRQKLPPDFPAAK